MKLCQERDSAQVATANLSGTGQVAEIFSAIWPVSADRGEVTSADDGRVVGGSGSAVRVDAPLLGWFVRFTGRMRCPNSPPTIPR